MWEINQSYKTETKQNKTKAETKIKSKSKLYQISIELPQTCPCTTTPDAGHISNAIPTEAANRNINENSQIAQERLNQQKQKEN